MDLTFQVPMQSCSLQHQTLLLSPVPSTTGYCFCFGSIPSFFLDQLTLGFALSVPRNCSSQGEPRTSGAATSILGTSPHLAFRSPHSTAFPPSPSTPSQSSSWVLPHLLTFFNAECHQAQVLTASFIFTLSHRWSHLYSHDFK